MVISRKELLIKPYTCQVFKTCRCFGKISFKEFKIKEEFTMILLVYFNFRSEKGCQTSNDYLFEIIRLNADSLAKITLQVAEGESLLIKKRKLHFKCCF